MGLRKKKSLMDQANGYVEAVRPQVESAVASAKEKAGPAIADAKEKAGPVIADAKAKAAPAIAATAAAAAEKAVEFAERAEEAADEATQPKKKKRSKLKKLLLVTGLAAGIAFAVKKFQGDKTEDNWQSSYVPSPPATEKPVEDAAGSSPDEALADQSEAPHDVTSPDEPAQSVDVESEDEQKS